jgi:hypothetical protein
VISPIGVTGADGHAHSVVGGFISGCKRVARALDGLSAGASDVSAVHLDFVREFAGVVSAEVCVWPAFAGRVFVPAITRLWPHG